MNTPQRVRTIGQPDGLDDPSIPFFIRSDMKGQYLRQPLYMYDSKRWPPKEPADVGLPVSDYESFQLFMEGKSQASGKTIDLTNMTTNGEVPKSEVWIFHQVEAQIWNSHQLNIWQHQELVWALAQGILTFVLDDREIFQVPLNRCLVGNPPHINTVSRWNTDTLASWPDVNNPHNSRLSDFAPALGFTHSDAIVAMRPASRFYFKYNADKDALLHLLQWLQRIPMPANHFIHDALKLRVAIRGRRFVGLEKPM